MRVAIICVDDNGGVMFNNRRVSSDKNVILDILRMKETNELFCSNYSASNFTLYNNKISVDEDVINNVSKDGIYFIEDIFPKNWNTFNYIIIYKWNRKYPSDVLFTYDLKDYINIKKDEFKGNSHEKIDKYIFKRKYLK